MASRRKAPRLRCGAPGAGRRAGQPWAKPGAFFESQSDRPSSKLPTMMIAIPLCRRERGSRPGKIAAVVGLLIFAWTVGLAAAAAAGENGGRGNISGAERFGRFQGRQHALRGVRRRPPGGVGRVARRKGRRRIAVPAAPTGVALSPDGPPADRHLRGAEEHGGRARRASGERLAAIPAGHTAMGPVVSPDGRRLYVCNRFDNDVSVDRSGGGPGDGAGARPSGSRSPRPSRPTARWCWWPITCPTPGPTRSSRATCRPPITVIDTQTPARRGDRAAARRQRACAACASRPTADMPSSRTCFPTSRACRSASKGAGSTRTS